MGPSSIEEDNTGVSDDPPVTDLLESSPVYTTELGAAFHGDSRELLKELPANSIDLIVTSPPFALQHEKEYGNEDQDTYNDWFMEFVPEIERVLQPHGSFIVEIGGAFEKGMPRRSIYQWKLLTQIVENQELEFAQDWYWYNPNKLPSPIEWVNVRKLRGVDAVTHIWWLANEINKDPAYTEDLQAKVETIRTLREDLADEITPTELSTLVEAILYGDVKLPMPDADGELTQTTFSSQAETDDDAVTKDTGLTLEQVQTLLTATRELDETAWDAEYNLDPTDTTTLLELSEDDEGGLDKDVVDILIDAVSPYTALSVLDLIVRTNKAPRVYGKEVLAALEDGTDITPPYPKPEVNNQRNDAVLKRYSDHHEELIETGEYNEGKRSSGHDIDAESFANENDGAIMKNFIEAPNTASNTQYQLLCREFGFERHPARFPRDIPEKFVNLLTPDPPYDEWERGDVGHPGVLDRPIVLDIFAGSNWTGKVAEDADRYWLSFERDEEYVRTSEFRFLSEAELQARLEDDDEPLQQFRDED
jgi:DNA modification methylase